MVPVAAALLFLLSLVAGVLLKSKFHSKIALFPFQQKQNYTKLQSQRKWLGHFGVSLSHQCWCTRFGDQTVINNFERDEGSTRREKQHLVKVSQLVLPETVILLLSDTQPAK